MKKTDLKYLITTTNNNPEIILELIDIFIDQIGEFNNDFQKLYDLKNFDALGKLAHKAKSSVAIMGMEDLARRLKDLENSTRDGKNVGTYAKTIAAFKQETAEAVRELNLVTKNLELYF